MGTISASIGASKLEVSIVKFLSFLLVPLDEEDLIESLFDELLEWDLDWSGRSFVDPML